MTKLGNIPHLSILSNSSEEHPILHACVTKLGPLVVELLAHVAYEEL